MDTVMQEYFDRMFGEIHHRFDYLEKRLDRVEARLDGLEARLDSLEVRFDGLEGEVKDLKDRVTRLEGRFDWLYNAVGELFESFAGDLSVRMDLLEGRVGGVESALGHLRTQVTDMNFRFTQDFLIVEGRLSGIERRLDQQGLLLTDARELVNGVAKGLTNGFEVVDRRAGILTERMGLVEIGLNKVSGNVDDLTVELRQLFRQTSASAALN